MQNLQTEKNSLWETPETWDWLTLKDVAEWKSGGTPLSSEKKYYGGDIPWLIIGDLNDGLVTSAQKSITQLGLDNSSVKRVKRGAILIAMYGSIGKLGIADIDCTTNQAIAFTNALSPEVFDKYLFYYLMRLRGYLFTQGKGGAQQNISLTVLNSSPFVKPPLPEQKRLVSKIEGVLQSVEQSKKQIQIGKKLINKFRQSVLSAAVTGKLTEEWRNSNVPQTKNESVEIDNFPFEIPSSWRVTIIEDIAEYTGGYAYKSTTFLKHGKNQVIRIGNVKQLNIFLDYSPVYIPETIAKKTQRFSLQANDILLSMTGTKYKRDYGFACIVPELGDNRLFLNQRVACLRLKTGIPEYLLYYLQTDFFRNYLFEGETGNVNQGNVGSTALRVIHVALPPKEEQEEIVKKIKSMFETADLVEKQIEKAGNKADKLTQSILATAFRGEL